MAVSGIYLVALAVFLPLNTEARTCYVGQGPEPEPGPGGYTRYRWVLQGEASLDPCGCTAFQLGGVNTVPSGGVVRSFNVSELSKTPEEIRRTFGCQQDDANQQRFVTTDGESILFPFAQFTTLLRSTFELKMADSAGRAQFYLAASVPATPTNKPPYLIEFTVDQVIITKSMPSPNPMYTIYEPLQTKTIPTEPTGRQFTVIYEYTAGVSGNAPTVDIEIIFIGQVGGEGAVHANATDPDGKVVQFVGISSDQQAEWKFFNP